MIRIRLAAIVPCIILIIFGSWLMLDGFVSIIMYFHQQWYEHAIRIVRLRIGIILICLAEPIARYIIKGRLP